MCREGRLIGRRDRDGQDSSQASFGPEVTAENKVGVRLGRGMVLEEHRLSRMQARLLGQWGAYVASQRYASVAWVRETGSS